jgi:hypothetical protein
VHEGGHGLIPDRFYVVGERFCCVERLAGWVGARVCLLGLYWLGELDD